MNSALQNRQEKIMQITRSGILSGDAGQLDSLFRLHAAVLPKASGALVDDAGRVKIAAIIQQRGMVDWQQDSNEILDSLLQGVDISAQLRIEIFFSLQVIRKFLADTPLEAPLLPLLQKLGKRLLVESVAVRGFWFSSHPLVGIMDFFQAQLVGWQDGFGKNSEDLKNWLQESVAGLDSVRLQENNTFLLFQTQLQESFRKQTANACRLASRLKDSETGILKARMSQFVVVDFINRTASPVRLPREVISFLQNRFSSEMRLLLLQQGLQAPLWTRWKKLLETMVRLYQLGVEAGSSAVNRKLLASLPDEITSLSRDSLGNAADEQLLNRIGFDFAQLLLGKEPTGLMDFPPMELSGAVAGVEKTVSRALLEKVRNIPDGQWFLYEDEKSGEQRRCRLLLRLHDYDQLLFVNFVGQKAMAVSYEDFAYLLSARHVLPVVPTNLLEKALLPILDKWLQNIEELQQQADSARLVVELKRKRQEEERQRAAMEEERCRAAEKARKEAEELAIQKMAEKKAEEERAAAEEMAKIKERERVADIDRKKQEEAARADGRRRARLMVDSMVLGSWVERVDPVTGKAVRNKLALKFNATGRYVFVDVDGVTVADLTRDELLDMVVDKKIRMLETDSRFADRLAKVVTSIRAGRS
jgi:hypothetical protein